MKIIILVGLLVCGFVMTAVETIDKKSKGIRRIRPVGYLLLVLLVGGNVAGFLVSEGSEKAAQERTEAYRTKGEMDRERGQADRQELCVKLEEAEAISAAQTVEIARLGKELKALNSSADTTQRMLEAANLLISWRGKVDATQARFAGDVADLRRRATAAVEQASAEKVLLEGPSGRQEELPVTPELRKCQLSGLSSLGEELHALYESTREELKDLDIEVVRSEKLVADECVITRGSPLPAKVVAAAGSPGATGLRSAGAQAGQSRSRSARERPEELPTPREISTATWPGAFAGAVMAMEASIGEGIRKARIEKESKL